MKNTDNTIKNTNNNMENTIKNTNNIIKDLELVDVNYENNKKKVTLTFLDKEAEEIRDVIFNKQSYNNGEFVDDPQKEEKVNQWCQEYF